MLFDAYKIKNLFKRRYKVAECSPNEDHCVSGSTGILAAISLVAFMVLSITYALYAFVHASGLSDLAGVHVTPPLKIAAAELANGSNDLYAGYGGWVTYSCDLFEIKYPDNWVLQKQDGQQHAVMLKKYNATNRHGLDSLAATISVSSVDVPDNLSMKDILAERGLPWDDSWKQQIMGGKAGIRTGEVTTDSGVLKDTLFWKLDGKLFSIEIDYFNKYDSQARNDFEGMVSQLRFF